MSAGEGESGEHRGNVSSSAEDHGSCHPMQRTHMLGFTSVCSQEEEGGGQGCSLSAG